VNSVKAAGGSKEYVQACKFSKTIVTTAWGVKVEWIEGNRLPISGRTPRVDIRWWQGFLKLEHEWHSNKEGAICDKRYHRDGALCCIRYLHCQVVFQSVLRARLLLE